MTSHPVTVANDAIKLTAAQRRDALLAECALQRAQLGVQTHLLLDPLTGGKLRESIMARVKKPLMVGGAVLGLMLLRPRRTLPLLLKASKLLRHAKVALPVIRSVLQRMDKQRAHQIQK
ncbi:hypothetical protein [Janthinobacterium sp.]|jgi:hypothetical protein|uniref:hypothetical protein n=1 Tax=Janthinobacterium sp. TaxID=1871054 RepID=UPI00289F2C51|nr:hypothetical protein [Janthinobacterium sp.]